MHLRLVEIENFRGIKQLSLKLDVITAVFGEGSFGKTSLVEALQLCLTSGPGDNVASQIPSFSKQDFHAPPGQDEPQAKRLAIGLTFRESTRHQWNESEYEALHPVINEWRDGRREISLRIEAEITSSDTIESRCVFLNSKQFPLRISNSEEILTSIRQMSPVIALGWHDTKYSALPPDGHSARTDMSVGNRYLLSLYRKAIFQPDRLTRDELIAAMDAISELEGKFPGAEAGRIERYQRYIEEIRETTSRFTPLIDNKSRLARFGDLHQLVALIAIVGTLLEARGTIDIPRSTEPIVAIANPETNLHPIALASFWDLLAQIPVQKLLVTNSDDLLSSVPLKSLRRIVREKEGLKVYNVQSKTLTTDDIRRIGYHLRLNRADAIMNRCWLLVEGESEGWLLPEMAHILGYDFKSEGIRCVEFAQCGLEPLIKLAQDLGIQWHLLVDGDRAGQSYIYSARRFLRGDEEFTTRISSMSELDIEHHLCRHGFLPVYTEAAGPRIKRNDSQNTIVKSAVKRNSKPFLMLKVIEYAQEHGIATVSPLLNNVVETCVALARREEPEYAVLRASSNQR
ncbi:MAG: ATP-dependent endonuclease [Candidatus Obscuribacterales bacterium]|nr:ATP-dependent endonuclease [Candidatus Obscuribacterales bacterium]